VRGTFQPAAAGGCIWSRLLSPIFWLTASSEREKALTKRGGSIFETAMSLPPCHRVVCRNPFQTSRDFLGWNKRDLGSVCCAFAELPTLLCAPPVSSSLKRNAVRRIKLHLHQWRRRSEMRATTYWAYHGRHSAAWLLVKLRLMLHCLLHVVQIEKIMDGQTV
jgi:hypothetical protein